MSKDVKREVVEELHRPARKNFRRRRVIVKGLNDMWQTDLVQMNQYSKVNKGYKYILVVINVFSKYAWCQPVKNKSGKEVTLAMKTILDQSKIKPKLIHSDRGGEYFNVHFKRLMERWKINHYSSFSSLKASVVERLNRTLKQQMWKTFSLRGDYKWVDVLQDIVSKYNDTVHRTIGMKPKDVKKKHEKYLLQHAYSNLKTVDPKRPKFKVNDNVRISKYREVFSKGYTPNWSNEIFKVFQVKPTNPTTYILNDTEGNQIQGGFYEYELQKAKFPDIYLVEKILRRKGNKLYIKWLGLSNKHNSWVLKNQIL